MLSHSIQQSPLPGEVSSCPASISSPGALLKNNCQLLPMAKRWGKERNRVKEKGLCFQVESSSPLFGSSEFDLHSRSMMPWSMGWTMPKRGLWEGSPSQQASISCQHSSSNTGRRSGRAPRERSMEIRPELVRGRPIQRTGMLSSQADDPVGAQDAKECNKLWLQLKISRLESNSNSDDKLEHTGIASWRIGNFKEKHFWDSSVKCCLMGGPAAAPGLSLLWTGEFGQSRAVALTSPHIVPEMVFAGTPLKCLRELDRAWADIPEKNAKSVDIHGIIILPYSKKGWQAVSQGEKSVSSPLTCTCRGLYTLFSKAFIIHYLSEQPC